MRKLRNCCARGFAIKDIRLRRQLKILACMYLGYGGMMVCRQAVPILSAAMIADPSLGLSKSGYGAIVGLGAGGALLGKLIWGPLSDILKGRKTFLLGLLLSSLLIAAFGVSPTAAFFSALVVALYCAKSAGWPAMTKLVENWYHPSKYGRVWGVLSTSSRASVVAGTLVLGACLNFLPWRAVAILTGGIGLAVLALCWFHLSEAPAEPDFLKKDQEDLSDEMKEEAEAALANKLSHPLRHLSLKEALRVFAKSGRVWLVCLSIMALTVLMEFLSFVPIYLVERFGVTPAQASTASSVFPLGSLVAVLIGGWVYDKLSRRRRRAAITLVLAGSTLCLLGLMYLPTLELGLNLRYPATLILIFLFGVSISPAYYLPMSVFSIEYGGVHSGVLVCLIDAAGFLAAMIYAPVAGRLSEAGWGPFMLLLIAVSVFAVVVTWLFLHAEYRASMLKSKFDDIGSASERPTQAL